MKKSKKNLPEKIASVVTMLVLIIAWFLGGQRQMQNTTEQLKVAAVSAVSFEIINGNIYQGTSTSEGLLSWQAIRSAPGYGGPLTTVISVNEEGVIEGIAIVESRETSSYLQEVTDSGLITSYLGRTIDDLPQIDGISGATLTSQSISRSVVQGSLAIGEQVFELGPAESSSSFPVPGKTDWLVIVLFVAAILVARTKFKAKKQARWTLLLSSLVLIGFYSSSQYSSATFSFLLSGMWSEGVASYTAIILLGLSVGYMIYSNKNIYCNYICPFGAAQECLGCITSPRVVRLKPPFFNWFPRLLLLTVLAMGLYFRNPGNFTYEPFGILFNMIGSTFLFALTVLVVLSSLIMHKPWCQQLCPVTQMFDFIRFNRNWAKQVWPRRG